MTPDRLARLALAAEALVPRGQLVSAEPLHGGISATTIKLSILAPDSKSHGFVARWPGPDSSAFHGDAAEAEFKILALAAESTISAPAPRYLAEPSPDRFFIMDFSPGEVVVNPAEPDEFVRGMATQLAAIHAVDISESDWSILPEFPPYGSARTNPPNPDLPEVEVRAAWETSERPPLEPPVLRHGDFWPGNVLWKNGEISAVIDWEVANRGQALADLAMSRLDILWILGPDAMEEFTAVYLAMSGRDGRHLRFWDLRAALRPMANLSDWATPYALWGRPDITSESLRRDLIWFCERALSATTSEMA